MFLYIFNPEANGGRAKKMKNKIIRYLEELDIMGDFIELKKFKDIKKVIVKAKNNDIKTIVAIGGDGIVNEIIQEIAGEEIELGIIPLGETNLLASILNIDNWQTGCEILTKKKVLDIDLGIVNSRYFTSSIEIENNNKESEGIFGLFSKKHNKKYYPIYMTINSETQELKLQTNIYSMLISTIPVPLPKELDIKEELVNKELNILIKSKPSIDGEKNKNEQGEELTILRGRKIHIGSKNILPVKIDGESGEKTPLNIKVAPKFLKVIIPENKSINTKD